MTRLTVEGLTISFGATPAVEDVSFHVDPGEVLGVVGESGSGKSVSILAIMGLLPSNARISARRLSWGDIDLLTLGPAARRKLIAGDIAMVFQDPMTALNPCFTVGAQVDEVVRLRHGLSRKAARARTVALFEQVGIPDAPRRADSYPHQLSGGMNQRCVIAMALAGSPKLLLADEPTTALDVTIQAQIMALLLKLQRDGGMGMVLITHDLGLVAQAARRIAVMYAGQMVEQADAGQLFQRPRHPYTAALLRAAPAEAAAAGARRGQLPAIPGNVPRPGEIADGCRFAPRCERARSACLTGAVLPDPEGTRCRFPLGSAS